MAMTDPVQPLNTAFRDVADASKRATDALKDFGRSMQDVFAPLANLAERFIKPFTVKIGEALRAGLEGLNSRVAAMMEPVAKRIGESLSALGERVGPWLKPFTQKLGDLVGTAFGNGTVGKIAGGLGGIAKAAGSFMGAAGQAVSAVVGLGQSIGALVQKANPALFDRFTVVLDDLMAVFGSALAPVMEVVIKLVRLFGDTFATFAGTIGSAIGSVLQPVIGYFKIWFDLVGRVGQQIGKIAQAAAPAIVALGEAFNAIIGSIMPIITLVVDLIGGALTLVMKGLAAVIKPLATGLAVFFELLSEGLTTIMNWVRALFGIEDKAGTKPGSSVGMAARQASTSSVESVLQKARESAFSLGRGAKAGEDPTSIAKEIREEIKKIKDAIVNLPKNLADAIRGKAADVATKAKDVVVDVVNPLPAGGGGGAASAAARALSWGRGRDLLADARMSPAVR